MPHIRSRIGWVCGLLSILVTPFVWADTRVMDASGVMQSGWTVTLSPPSLTLSPGQSGSSTITVTSPTTAPPGVYTITITASDGTAIHTATRSVTYTVADVTAPTVPTNLSATANTKGQAKSVTLQWTASRDDVGVTAYTVRRDGVPIGSVTTTAFVDGSIKRNVSYTYGVAAMDGAGNLSAFASVTIKP